MAIEEGKAAPAFTLTDAAGKTIAEPAGKTTGKPAAMYCSTLSAFSSEPVPVGAHPRVAGPGVAAGLRARLSKAAHEGREARLSISRFTLKMTGEWPCGLGQREGILRQIISNFIPCRAVIDEGMILRTDARIVVKSSHANGNFIAFRPIAAKQA